MIEENERNVRDAVIGAVIIVLLVVLIFAGFDAGYLPPWCTVSVRGHDAIMAAYGPGALKVCRGIASVQGNGMRLSLVPLVVDPNERRTETCRVRKGAVTVVVRDSGLHIIGSAVCAGLTMWNRR